MRKRVKPLVYASTVVIAIGAIFCSWKLQSTSAQAASYQLVVWCDDSGLPAEAFWYDVPASRSAGLQGLCAGKCKGRTVSIDEALAGLPAQVSAGLMAQVAKHEEDAAAGIGHSIAKCVGMGNANQPPPKPKCVPPRVSNTSPWLNGDAPCQNRQRGTYSSGQNRRNPHIESVTISICGEVIRFEQRDLWDSSERRRPVVYSFDVCCDTWQKAASTGSPCDARRDIDCDGELNDTDPTPLNAPSELPSDTDFVSNSPLTNLPFWKQLRPHMPSQSECKNCKWELVRVDYTCKDEVTEYYTTWKCPATGQLKKGEVGFWFNRSRCPIPPNRSWP